MDLCDISVNKCAQFIIDMAQDDGQAPVCICVYDRNGFITYFLRMQGSIKIAIPIAMDKAKTAALMGVSTRDFHKRLVDEKLSIADFAGTAATSLTGGIPLIHNDKILGGVGISGRKPVDDEKLAILFAKKFNEIIQEK